MYTKKLAILFLISIPSLLFSQGKGEITGQILDDETLNPISDVSVQIKGTTIGTETNDSGIFYLSNLESGFYEVKLSKLNYKTVVVSEVRVISGNTTPMDEKLSFSPIMALGDLEVDIVEERKYRGPEINPFVTSTGDVITTEELQGLPNNEVSAAIPLVSGVTETPTGGFSFRGARVESNAYFIDGIRINGEPNLPSRAVYSMEVITGGIPAKYGDLTGGVVLIETGGFFNQ